MLTWFLNLDILNSSSFSLTHKVHTKFNLLYIQLLIIFFHGSLVIYTLYPCLLYTSLTVQRSYSLLAIGTCDILPSDFCDFYLTNKRVLSDLSRGKLRDNNTCHFLLFLALSLSLFHSPVRVTTVIDIISASNINTGIYNVRYQCWAVSNCQAVVGCYLSLIHI